MIQISVKQSGNYLSSSLRGEASAYAREQGRFAGTAAAYDERVNISAEGSHLQKILRGEEQSKNSCNVSAALGQNSGAAEENPDARIREIQKELREALKEQSEAMLGLHSSAA